MPEISELDANIMDDSDSEEDFTAMPELCDKEKKTAEEVEEAEKKQKQAAVTVDEDGWEDVLGSGRLKKKVVKEGEGDKRPVRGNRVLVTVEERLAATGEVVAEEHQLEFNVDESEVVQCLDLALPLMTLGEVALLKVDHTFAYGEHGDKGRVPPAADLEMTVTLVRWRELDPVPDIPLEERAQIGNQKRERGNAWYSKGDYKLAVQCYRKAAEYLDDKQIELDMEVPIDRYLLPKDIQELLENRVKTFNNMAQAQMKLKAWDASMTSVRQVLKIQPNNEKALFRKAMILQEKCQLEEAIGILRRINRLYPANKQCHTELTRLTNKVKASRSAEQNMSRKMLGLDKQSTNSSNSTSFFSKRVQVSLAALGGLGALVGAYLLKHYSMQ